jgi:predicted nucleic acid-binding protein
VRRLARDSSSGFGIFESALRTGLGRDGSSTARRSTLSGKKRHVLVDTNVWINAVDPREQAKGRIANRLIEGLVIASLVAITPQIAAEFFNVATRPRQGQPPLLSTTAAAGRVTTLLEVCTCFDMSAATAAEAVRGAVEFQMHIYDAHIWAVARLNGVATILTADLQSREVIEGVRYVDPFASSFKLAQIGL